MSKPREYWIKPSGKMYQPEFAYSIKSELEKVTHIIEADKIIHLREVIPDAPDLAPGIEWAIRFLKNYAKDQGNYNSLRIPAEAMSYELREESARQGIKLSGGA